jgi:hypothetical protein
MRTRAALVPISTALLLALLLTSSSLGWAQGPGTPQGNAGIAAMLNSRISYQGVLKEGGAPVSGPRDMVFRLYSDSVCTTQVGSDIVKAGVPVSNGLFSVELDVAQGDFDGQGLWLEVEVGGTAIGCREILPVPYALSLRPGARVEGAVLSADTAVITAVNTEGGMFGGDGLYGQALSGAGVSGSGDPGVRGANWAGGQGVEGVSATGWGVYGRATGGGGYGVYGYAQATTGGGIGVYAQSDASAGTGLQASAPIWGVDSLATATTGTAYGVRGRSASPDGYGGYFWNTASSSQAIGVLGRSDSTEGWGVQGWASSTTGNTIGVYGFADSPGGIGVQGYARVGVYGLTAGTAGLGVWGFSQSLVGGHGVYAQSRATGGAGAALWAQADNTTGGIAIWGHNSSGDSTMVLENFGSGDLLKAYISGGELRFRVDNAGEVYADGTFHTPAADLAEMLPAAAGLEPGDVLVIGPDGKLARCTEAYQATVVGVYSTRPAFVGGASEGKDAAGRVPLAVMGVVPVKVTAKNGAIAPGDLLVASATPGHAMKAGPNPLVGTVIGKALQRLDRGNGIILMLVVLQ